MPRTKGKVNFEDLPQEKEAFFLAIRDIALDNGASSLKGLGFSDERIAKAREECIASNSEKPFQDLMKEYLRKNHPELY